MGLSFGVLLTVMVLTSSLLGRLVDYRDDRGIFFSVLAVIVVALLCENVARNIGQYLLVSKIAELAIFLRQACVRSVLAAPIPQVVQLGTGNVISRLTKDVDRFSRAFQEIGARLVITAFMFPFTTVALAFVHWSFIVIVCVVVVVEYPLVKIIVRDFPPATNAMSEKEATRNNTLLDTIKGLGTIRALGRHRWALARVEQKNWAAVQAMAGRIPIFSRLLLFGTTAYGLLLCATLVLATFLAHEQVLSVGQAGAAVILVARLEIHLFNVLTFSAHIQNAVTSLGRAVSLALLGKENTTCEPADLSSPEVIVSNVSYSYPQGAAIIEDLSLRLAAGSTTALVGASGAGKSTLAALIAGLQQPTAGTIYIGDVDTRLAPDSWIARHVALISQQVHLFSGTLREDLHLAAENPDDEQLLEALSAVGLSGTVFSRWFPQGLDTPIGAGADELSPEVEQQISLARILLRNPPVLIMDESTSEAGSEHAKTLEHAATLATRGRTSLIVAHRLDQARGADRIILMDNGAIIEDGTHDELINAGGAYAKLYAHWDA
ncbi:ABC transporter ATP-binding protein [Corynebacterium felinum]